MIQKQKIRIVKKDPTSIDMQQIPWPDLHVRLICRLTRRKNIIPFREFKNRLPNNLNCQQNLHREFKEKQMPYQINVFHEVPIIKVPHSQLRHNMACCFKPNTVLYTVDNEFNVYDYEQQTLQKVILREDFIAAGLSVAGRHCAIAGIKENLCLYDLINRRTQYIQVNDFDCVTNQAMLFSQANHYNQHQLTTSQMTSISDIHVIICDNNKKLYSLDLNGSLDIKNPLLLHQRRFPNKKFFIFINKIPAVSIESLQALMVIHLLDYHNNKIVMQLEGHSDYSFSLAFNPAKEWELATGNQDSTCIVWDLRQISKPVTQIKSALDAVYHVSYTLDGNYLIVGEGIDSLHIYDCQSNYVYNQTIDYFGSISGVGIDLYDQGKFFFGVQISQYQGIFELKPCNSNSSLMKDCYI